VGLGSTAVACARLGVDFIGADLDNAYLDEAVARTENVPKMKKATLRPAASRLKKSS
jgi:DNA modification methylase